MPTCCVYLIENLLNKKVYVGSTVNAAERKAGHLWHLRRGTHFNAKLQNAYNKYGEVCFRFRVLMVCTYETLVEMEQLVINSLNAAKDGYNIRPVAERGGWTHSVETRRKMSASQKKAQTGKVLSKETRAKMSAAKLGKKQSPIHRLKRRLIVNFGNACRRIGVAKQMNTVIIEKNDEAMAKALEGCKVGVPITLTLEIIPLLDDGGKFIAEITAVSYKESAPPVEEEVAPAPEKRPYKPKADMAAV